jgi:hypothetical protein
MSTPPKGIPARQGQEEVNTGLLEAGGSGSRALCRA